MIYQTKKTLSVLQLNVRHIPEAHEIDLSQAYSDNIDIILIQEPYIYKNLT